jgi:hypothetical protein
LDFSVPNAAFAGYRLKGVDIFEQGGRKFAYLEYQKDGKIIGYLIFKDVGFSIDLPETVNNVFLFLKAIVTTGRHCSQPFLI